MITADHVKKFREEGFFILHNLFSAEEIDALTEHIDRFAASHEEQLRTQGGSGISRPNEISFTAHLASHDPTIMAFTTRNEFIELTSTLLKDDISLYWDQAVYKKPETPREFPWHQDNGYFVTDPAEYVTCWLALDDATVENGCIWVIPRSHHQGLVEHKDTSIGKQCYFGEDPGIPVPLRKGSMAVFSSLLFHRSGPNVSNTVRKGYIIQYCVAHTKSAATGEPLNRLVIARNGKPVPLAQKA
jgi:phytanoyl-CoA hydroxylase